nr:hypothetical protein [Moritella viscosa]SHO13406.1 Putative uncharacterized protein [Moritella viscosa]
MHIPSKEQLKKISKFKKMSCDKFTASFLMKDSSNLEAFLYSKTLFKFSRDDRQALLKALEKSTQDIEQKFCFQYLNFAFGRADWCYDASKELITNCSVENILSYFEFNLNRMIKKNIDIDGVSYPTEIIHSKHSFLLSVIPTAIFIAQQENLPTTTGKLLKDNDKSKMTLLIIAQYHSIKRQIVEVMKGTYSPKPISYLDKKYGPNSSKHFSKQCKYFLQRAPENLDSIEIYRDLNYAFTYSEERDIEQSISTMKEAGAIKNYIEGEFIHFDMSKNKEFEEIQEIKNISELIENVYGSVDSDVLYQDIKFTIRDMIGLVRKIIKLSNEIKDHRQENCKHICIYKQSFKNLSKQLKLTNLEKDILPFFSIDLASKNLSEVENKPFFNIDNIYYMFTPATVELCYEKVLDKILSQKKFSVQRPLKAKGIMFEDKIINLFSDAGFEVGQINRNEKKNIPEIDALVNFDDENILVIEAKCTIKPEERLEVFSFIENHLSKAVNQLIERVFFLTSNPDAANERLKFSIEQKKIIPIIITNHSFFSGQRFVMKDGLVVYCIDDILLSKIISQNYIPSWLYTGSESNYVPKDKSLRTKQEKLGAILNPVANLLGKAHRTIQPLGSGSAVEIYKQPSIDRLEQLRRKVDL